MLCLKKHHLHNQWTQTIQTVGSWHTKEFEMYLYIFFFIFSFLLPFFFSLSFFVSLSQKRCINHQLKLAFAQTEYGLGIDQAWGHLTLYIILFGFACFWNKTKLRFIDIQKSYLLYTGTAGQPTLKELFCTWTYLSGPPFECMNSAYWKQTIHQSKIPI